MKIVRFGLFVLFVTIRLITFSQQKIDSVHQTDGLSNGITAKEIRKANDSIAKNLSACRINQLFIS